MSNDIVPPRLAVKAMRDNGYKNAAYALAELLDNAIQAGASYVELLCKEADRYTGSKTVKNVSQVAVVDNGSGMSEDVLLRALQFGNGNYLDEKKHTGIGRFGMGLPSSSMSQCKKVEVWSWQDGYENALYTYLDLEKIIDGEMSEVPEPESKEIPVEWVRASKTLSQNKSGTLILWSDLDKCSWRTGRAILDNSEFLIGRIYRRFIVDNKVFIRMGVFHEKSAENVEDYLAVANDPLYLMTPTSCPEPYKDKPMFVEYSKQEISIWHKGKEHTVTLRASYAHPEARPGRNPGSSPYGKHAAKNLGVSIVRADRELELDPAWTNSYDSTERWWSIEVDFPPSLDDVFGVTNNKQSAVTFAQLAKVDYDELLKDDKTLHQTKEEWEDYQDPRLPLLDLSIQIGKNINAMRSNLKASRKGQDQDQKRHHDDNVAGRATDVTKKRQDEGHKGRSDDDESLPEEEQKKSLIKDLVDQGATAESAELKATRTVDSRHRYLFTKGSLETPAFFSTKPSGGKLLITLNVDHPAYENLLEALEENTETDDKDELSKRLVNARDGINLLLTAWARYEDEQPDGRRREAAQEARTDWGRVARDFLRDPL